ncbi:MAG: RraA family protein [Sedimentibacter sp.]
MDNNRIGKIGFSIIENINRPEKVVYDKLANYTTPNLSDAMNRFRTMASSIKPIHENCKFMGPAVTVRVRPGDNLMVHKAIDIAKPGDVIVISTGDCSTNAVWGELMTRAAQKKGIVAAVIEGGARDINENKELKFSIFAKYVVASACDKDGPGEINEAISCGGVVVCPGDIIVGDENGVVVIPPELVNEVIKNTDIKVNYERKRIADIDKGMIISEDIDEILRKKGVII